MALSLEVARYLVELAESGEEPDYLTPLRLQKLLYYVQGWSLATLSRPMFIDRIEAWTNGPVVCDVYRSNPAFQGMRVITLDDFGRIPAARFSAEEKLCVDAVWDAYKCHSAISLRNKTHLEAPWQVARRGYAVNVRSNEEIPQATMKDYFASLRDHERSTRREITRFDRLEAELREIERDIAEAEAAAAEPGRVSLDDLMAELGI